MSGGIDLIVNFPLTVRRQRKGTGVSFADHVRVHIVDNLSLKYKDDLWFTRKDMESFKYGVLASLSSILSTGQTMAQYAQSNIEDSSVFLGLENYLQKSTPVAVRHRRERMIRGVLLEQQRQLYSGTHDPEALAIISSRLSRESRLRARTIGLIHIGNSL